MTQQQIDQQVADATGEDIESIRNRGFSVVEPIERLDIPEVDWVDLNEYPPPRPVTRDFLAS